MPERELEHANSYKNARDHAYSSMARNRSWTVRSERPELKLVCKLPIHGPLNDERQLVWIEKPHQKEARLTKDKNNG